LLQLHPVLQTKLSVSQIQQDIDIITDTASTYVKQTDDIDFDVFVPFDDVDSMEQVTVRS